MTCPCCRQAIDEGEVFCRRCGVRMNAALSYRELAEVAAADGRIHASERAWLANKAQALGLSPEQCEAIEAELELDVGEPAESEEREPRVPVVSLCINRNRQFIQTVYGVLEYQVTNVSSERLEEVEITTEVENTGIPLTRTLLDLDPGQKRRVLISFNSGDHCGQFPVRVGVETKFGNGREACDGEYTLRVFECPPRSTQVSFGDWVNKVTIWARDAAQDVSGMNIQGADPAKAIEAAVKAGLIRNVNDYLEQWEKLPPNYEQIELFSRQVGGRRKFLSKRFVAVPSGVSPISLRIRSGPGQASILLFTENPVRFGRDRSPNHLVLRYLPRSEQNDRKSRRIGGVHGAFVWRADGFSVEDHKSINGTSVDDRALESYRPTAVRSGQTICVGNVLELRATASAVPVNLDATQYADVAELPWSRTSGPMLGAVRVDRVNNLQNESYLFIRDVALIGSRPDAAVFIKELAPAHAYLFVGGGAIWVEAVVEGQVAVDDVPLHPGELASLQPGLTLKLGSVHVEVCEREQPAL